MLEILLELLKVCCWFGKHSIFHWDVLNLWPGQLAEILLFSHLYNTPSRLVRFLVICILQDGIGYQGKQLECSITFAGKICQIIASICCNFKLITSGYAYNYMCCIPCIQIASSLLFQFRQNYPEGDPISDGL
jgi:hypothetical protein